MRILGIDPGSRRTGWGVVQLEGTRLRQIGAGTIKVAEKLPLGERLHLPAA
jgi:crossover junction endodeoxyribonuclease RuvC